MLSLKFGAMAFVAAIAATLSSQAIAGAQGKINYFKVNQSSGLHYLALIGSVSARPSCASATTYYMVRDENSRAGQTMIAMIMSAWLSGKAITITGTGACTRYSDGEDILTITFED